MEVTLKAARINAEKTANVAAAEIGVTAKTLRSWEKGVTIPNTKYIPLIEKCYGCTYADIRFTPRT